MYTRTLHPCTLIPWSRSAPRPVAEPDWVQSSPWSRVFCKRCGAQVFQPWWSTEWLHYGEGYSRYCAASALASVSPV